MKMNYTKHILAILVVLIARRVSSDILVDESNNINSKEEINKRDGLYTEQDYQKQWEDYYAAIKTQHHDIDRQDGSEVPFDVSPVRQDSLETRQGESDIMMMVVGGLTLFAAGAATYGLIQNAQQASDYDSLKSRVSSLETDQTSICTKV